LDGKTKIAALKNVVPRPRNESLNKYPEIKLKQDNKNKGKPNKGAEVS
jgi:hypothetical protein